MRPQNIEHPDIPKLKDNELYAEFWYYYGWMPHILDAIYHYSENPLGSKGLIDGISYKKTISDLSAAIDRVEAIRQEIDFRAEMMR